MRVGWTAALANKLGGVVSGSEVHVRRGRLRVTRYRVAVAGRRLCFSAERSWPRDGVAVLHADLLAFEEEVRKAANDDRAIGLHIVGYPLSPPPPATVRGRPYEFGLTLRDLFRWHERVEFSASHVRDAVEMALVYESGRRHAFWAQMAFLGPLVLLTLMAAAWAAPLNWSSVGIAWSVLLAFSVIYARAAAKRLLGRGAMLAVAATVAIAGFGLVYASLLTEHPLSPLRASGPRLGQAFLLSVGVGATAGTFDQPLRESMRIVIHLQLLLFVGGTAGTAAWAAWRAIRGIAEVDDDLAAARTELAELGTDVNRVAGEVQLVQGKVDEATKRAAQSISGTAEDVAGSLGALREQLHRIEQLLRGLAEHVGYEGPPTA